MLLVNMLMDKFTLMQKLIGNTLAYLLGLKESNMSPGLRLIIKMILAILISIAINTKIMIHNL